MKKGCILIILLVLFNINAFSALAAQGIILDKSLSKIEIGQKIEYLEDKEDCLTLDDIKGSKYKRQWISSKKAKPSFGFTQSAYWVRFSIENNTNKNIEFYLEHSYALLDKIKLYIPEKDGYREIISGDYRPFFERPVDSRTFVFPIMLKAKTEATYYMYNQMKGTLYIDLKIWSPEHFYKAMLNENRMLMLFYGIILVMIAYNLILFLFIRRFEYLFYVLFIFSALLFLMTLEGTLFQFFWPDSPEWTNISMPIFINILMISINLFGIELVEIRKIKSMHLYLKIIYYWIISFIVIYVILTFMIPVIPYLTSLILSASLAGIMLFSLVVILFILIIKEKSRPALLGICAASMILIGGIAYVLKTFAILPTNFLTEWSVHIGAVFMVILFSIALADRINIMRKEVELLNNHLEDKVKSRTEELYSAMEALEAINTELSKTNEQLVITQEIARKDMLMASNVQSSIFPKEPPATDEWEISFLYKPMSGVSGDFYDFYTSNGRLTGIAIFDVSGHGIASGLITMMARSIFFRNFESYKKYSLNKVLEKSNNELINEMGKLENYLTGILLRLNGEKIEYVNAGHPDLILKKANSGKVVVLNNKEEDLRGPIIGTSEYYEGYKTLSFNVSENDILLLYTDCFFECRNKEGEAFGLKRIINALEKIPEGSTQSILNLLISNFNNFTGEYPLKDDLTVIVAKKKNNHQ